MEDWGDEVIVTVRDDGPGIAAGRLDQAAGEGRLGVAQSIRGGCGTWAARPSWSPYRGRAPKWN